MPCETGRASSNPDGCDARACSLSLVGPSLVACNSWLAGRGWPRRTDRKKQLQSTSNLGFGAEGGTDLPGEHTTQAKETFVHPLLSQLTFSLSSLELSDCGGITTLT